MDVIRQNVPSGFTALASGTVLGRYRIESVIAAGGFGITYLCRHSALDKLYALKEHFPRQLAYRDGDTSTIHGSDEQMFNWSLARFLREGRSLAKCAHPNVVSVADIFEANGTAYMVLDYESGKSFKAWLTSLSRAPTQPELDALLMPLLEALEYVHGQGMLHRDIAPDNIIVRTDGTPCLIDFGSARQAVAEQSQMMSAIVKQGYSPIEQYASSGRSQGPWSDIYALAATFYLAVAGRTPPEATERQVGDDLVPVAAAVADPTRYRGHFLAAIDRALRLKPSERPQSVGQWRASLLGTDPDNSTQGARSNPSRLPRAAVATITSGLEPSTRPRVAITPAAPEDAPAAGRSQATPPPSRRSGAAVLWLVALLALAGGGAAATYAYRPALLGLGQPLPSETARPATPPSGTVTRNPDRDGDRSASTSTPASSVDQRADRFAKRPAPAPDTPAPPIAAAPSRGSAAPATAPVPGPMLPNAAAIAEIIKSVPAFPPVEGLAEAVWKQPCSACHKWTLELLCKQGQTYVKAPEQVQRHPHPFGGVFKETLRTWAQAGCN